MNPYGETIQDHSRHPRNYGSLEAPDIRHEDVNPFCGDRVRIEVTMAPDDTVREARFQGDLCVIAKAASSLLTVMITGAHVDAVNEESLLRALNAEIQPARRKCALLPLMVLQSGVAQWRKA
jgi:nitrogen fixation protein NifU and related proteins